jgi:ribokinase
MKQRRQPRLVVVGSSNTDLVIQCERLPRPGETLLGGEFHRFAGGKGANQAVAAARAGARVSFIGARGDDDFGRAAHDGLRAEGVDVRFFRVRKSVPSGVALILVGGRSRQNLIAVARSANDTVSAADVRAARSAFRGCAAVVAQLEIPPAAVEAAAALAAGCGAPFILNPAPARRLSRRLLRRVYLLTPNEQEAMWLSGRRQVRHAARRLLQLGCANVAVTLGARGGLLVNADGEKLIPAPRVRPVDTVGAGDCFAAWAAVGIAEGLSLTAAIQRAVRAAAIAVTRSGAQAGMPYRRELAG